MWDHRQVCLNEKADEAHQLRRELQIHASLRAKLMRLKKAERSALLTQVEALLR